MPMLGLDQTPEDADRNAAIAKRANAIFIASLFSILFCCIGGVLASVMAHRAKQEADAGNFESAERGTNIAMVVMIASFVLGGLAAAGQLSAALR